MITFRHKLSFSFAQIFIRPPKKEVTNKRPDLLDPKLPPIKSFKTLTQLINQINTQVLNSNSLPIIMNNLHPFISKQAQLRYSYQQPITTLYHHFVQSNLPKEEYLKIVNHKLEKNIDTHIAKQMVMLLDHLIKNFKLTNEEYQSLLSNQRNLFYLIKNPNRFWQQEELELDEEEEEEEEEQVISIKPLDECQLETNDELKLLNLFHHIVNQLLDSNIDPRVEKQLITLMKSTRMFHYLYIDKLSHKLYEDIHHPNIFLYLSSIARCGQGNFTELFYKMRDHYLDNGIDNLNMANKLYFLDALVRCRYKFMWPLIEKLLFSLDLERMSSRQKVKLQLLYLYSRSNIIDFNFLDKLLIKMVQDIPQFNFIQFRMMLYGLSTLKYYNKKFFVELQTKMNLKAQLERLLQNANERDVVYLKTILQYLTE